MHKLNNNYPFNDDDIPINNEFSNKNNSINKNKKSNKMKNILLIVTFIIFLSIFVFSTIKIIYWYIDNKNTENTIKQVEEIIDVEEIKDTELTELINEPINEEKESDYWYYIKFPLIQVDFNELVSKNSDTVGWIKVNNTNINYPVVQTDDNDYYLNRSYDKSINDAGWVFMDFRNNADFSSKNTIIYAHSRLNKTMFGSLSKTLKPDWYKNKDNHIINISTPNENSLWQIFSVYTIAPESYYITTDFSSNSEYLEFLDTIKKRSRHDFNTTLSENDSIITLSTCYSDTKRTVVHAKKIKKSNR